MGQGFSLHCRKCGVEKSYFYGIGFMYFDFLEKTKKEIINGKYGHKAQQFYESHPNAEIDARYEVYYCEECKHIKQGVDLKMVDVDNTFQKEYLCGKCRKVKMKPYRIDTLEEMQGVSHIPCENCGATDSMDTGMMMWD